MKKGETHQLTIEKMAYKALGIAYLETEQGKLVVFVPNTIPGEVCNVLIVKKKKGYIEGRKIAKIKASPMEIAAPCPYFGVCGGCKWQHMPYEKQLEYKESFITESIAKIGKITDIHERLPMIPSPLQYGYRNKIELSFGVEKFIPQSDFHELKMSEEKQERETGRYLGYHGSGSFSKIVDIDACLLGSDMMNDILKTVKDFVFKKKLIPYNPHTHEGLLRHIVIREGSHTGELMVNLITNETEDYTSEFFEPMVDSLLLLERDIYKFESILWTQNGSLSDVAKGTNLQVIHGKEYIFEKVGDYLFKISPYSFFQTNTKGAEKLYSVVDEFADLAGGEIVLDLYSGTGTIGMYLAKKAKKVFSLEINPEAVADAKVNATMNNIMNIEFLSGKVEEAGFSLVFERPDVVVIDPPRAGMHPKALGMFSKFGAQKIVYVSCNPTTLARDLEFLSTWYQVEKVQGVDMFPQTYHIETVVLLTRK